MKTLTICAMAITLGIAGPAGADEDDIARGLKLAKHWCTGCHVIGPDIAGGDVGPSFVSVAGRWLQTEQAIRNWLAAPHPPMPDFDFGAAETDDLAQYIMSLAEE